MRIIAGKWRSRKLEFPPESVTRPMSDRVRETVFNILGCYYGCPGELPRVYVADVFAGSGSLGLEALSRGAEDCVFFEKDRRALDVLARNLSALQVGMEAHVVAGDAWQKALIPAALERPTLIFLDPPYADSRDAGPNGHVGAFLNRWVEDVREAALVVLHHDVKIRYDSAMFHPWIVQDHRNVGSSGVTIFHFAP